MSETHGSSSAEGSNAATAAPKPNSGGTGGAGGVTSGGVTSGGGVAKSPRVILCPYCGHAQQGGDRCVQCSGLFEPLSRRATQIAMGPWYLRDRHNPFRPGCSYEVIQKMVAAGRITPTTVMRGPTTRQFWSIARNIPGVAHLLGYCHRCGQSVSPTDAQCPHCETAFKGVKSRNELGLQFPNRRAAEAAQRSLNRHLGITPPTAEDAPDAQDDRGVPQDPALDEKPTSTLADDPTDPTGHDDAFEESDALGDLLDDVYGGDIGTPPPTESDATRVEALDFAPSDEHESTTPAPGSPPEVPGKPRDSYPSALGTSRGITSEGGTSGGTLPPRRGISPLVWVLIALNVLIAVAVIYFVLTMNPA